MVNPLVPQPVINEPGTSLEITGTALSITFPELFTTLIKEGVIQPMVNTLEGFIPPGFTLILNVALPINQVLITAQERIWIDTDHVFSLTVTIDGKYTVLQDPDMVQGRYNTPIDSLQLAIVPITKYYQFVIVNNSTSMAYWSDLTFLGQISTKNWNLLVANYFRVISGEIGYTSISGTNW